MENIRGRGVVILVLLWGIHSLFFLNVSVCDLSCDVFIVVGVDHSVFFCFCFFVVF